MKLSQLLSVFPQLRLGATATQDVLDIAQDSRRVKPGTVFVAVRGTTSDGHEFLANAAQQGAIALVVEDDARIPSDYTGSIVKVANSRSALDLLACRFFGDPARDMFCVGVTGTNGKTTVAYMLEAIFTHFGWPTGVMGTIDHHLGEHKWASALTTPDALTLQRRLKEFDALKARAAVFEVSSHALDQARVESLPFDAAVFTNFTRDHLDYHRTMENYFASKERLFSELLGVYRKGAVAVLNADDPWVEKVRLREGVHAWWFGKEKGNFSFRILREDLGGSLFHLSTPRGNGEIHLPSPGTHNVFNAAAAVAAAFAAGVSLATATEALSEFHGAPGRLQKIPNPRGIHMFVDYAHTDDALRSVLRSLAQLNKSGRILTVFGCGGDRDRGKRPLMARAATEFSDQIVITSDNPRTEDPLAIIQAIESGIPSGWKGVKRVEPDRRQALAAALQMVDEGDVILVAGKGHEDYQIVGTEKHPFSDVAILSELLNGAP